MPERGGAGEASRLSRDEESRRAFVDRPSSAAENVFVLASLLARSLRCSSWMALWLRVLCWAAVIVVPGGSLLLPLLLHDALARRKAMNDLAALPIETARESVPASFLGM